MKQLFTYLILVLLFTFCGNKLYAQSPNVIVIIADDMGWSQVSTPLTNLNNESDFYETPTIETLATEGIAFPHGYVNGANCAPTRAALLSGQYAARPTNNIFAVDQLNRGGNSTLLIGPDNGLPNGIDELPVAAITLAETMKTAGYATVHLGKYHVGENESTNSSNNAATDQGFDVNFGGGTKGNPGSYFATGSPGNYTFNANIGPELDIYADPYTASESLMLAGDNSLTGTAKHVTDAMADAAIDFMDANNIVGDPFFMHFSNFAIHGPIGESNSRPDLYAKYQAKNTTNPSSMGHTNIAIGAIAEGMDQSISRLIDYLKTTEDPRSPGNMLSKNTLVYFISDNGGAINTQENGPLRGMKGDLYEGGIRSITLVWSEASWLANKGTVNTTPVIGFDIYPTFVEAAGGTLPVGYDIDGVSHWQMLTNGTALSRESIFWHFPGYIRDQKPVTVMRKGDYKLIHNYETEDYELYDLINDISEATNLLDGSPSQVTIDLANDMITDMIAHLTITNAPLLTYRSGANAGNEVPLPALITSAPASNSTAGCQAISGYEAYWDFDMANDTDDASSNGHNAVSGVPTYDSVDFIEGDQSVVFNGSTEIQYSDGSFLTTATSERTISVWIKPSALLTTQVIFEEGGSGNGLSLRLNGTSLEASLSNNQSNSNPNHTVSTAYPNDSNWHHVAMVFDGSISTLKLYIDGVLGSSTTGSYTELADHSSPGGIGGVITGDAFGSGGGTGFFTGKMDALAIYNSVLSDSQINDAACITIVNSTAGCQPTGTYEAFWDFDMANDANDASGNNHDPNTTLSGAITYDVFDFKEGDRSIVFNGTEAIQYATNSVNPDSFMNDVTNKRSVMAWIKPSGLSGIQDIYDEGGQNTGIAIRLNDSNLESIVRESSTMVVSSLSASFPNDGDWHHVALIFDGANTSHKLYLDGVQVATSSSAPLSLDSHFSFGGIGGKLSGNDSFQNSSNAYFTGKMDAFAYYELVLTPTQIEDSACNNTLSSENISSDVSSVYPNPFKTEINVSLGSVNNKVKIELYDLLGKSIFVKDYFSIHSVNIPVQNLSKGLYLIKITTDNQIISKKLLKE